MFFTDNVHAEEFLKLVRKYRKERERCYVAAYYLLTASQELRIKAFKFISVTDGSIEWERLKENDDWPVVIAAANIFLGKEVSFNDSLLVREPLYVALVAQAVEISMRWPRCYSN